MQLDLPKYLEEISSEDENFKGDEEEKRPFSKEPSYMIP